jgi:hypothetical protein
MLISNRDFCTAKNTIIKQKYLFAHCLHPCACTIIYSSLLLVFDCKWQSITPWWPCEEECPHECQEVSEAVKDRKSFDAKARQCGDSKEFMNSHSESYGSIGGIIQYHTDHSTKSGRALLPSKKLVCGELREPPRFNLPTSVGKNSSFTANVYQTVMITPKIRASAGSNHGILGCPVYPISSHIMINFIS